MKDKWKEALGLIAHFSEPAVTDLDEGQSPTEPEGGSGGEGPNLAVVPDQKPEPDAQPSFEFGPETKAVFAAQGIKDGKDLEEMVKLGKRASEQDAAEKAEQERQAALEAQRKQGTEAEQKLREEYFGGLQQMLANTPDDPVAQWKAEKWYDKQWNLRMLEIHNQQLEESRRKEQQAEIETRRSREKFFADNPDLLRYRGLIEDTVAMGAPPSEVVQFIRQVKALDEQHPTNDDIPLSYTLPGMTKKDLWKDLAKSGRTQGHAVALVPETTPEDDAKANKELFNYMFGKKPEW